MSDEPKDNLLRNIWRSAFRHDRSDTPRNRIRQITESVWLHLHPPKIPKNAIRFRYTWCAGGMAFFLLIFLTLTGAALLFFYRPTPEHAYHDIQALQYEVPYGWLLRNVHRWSAHGMVAVVWLHMLRVFLTGSYKPPREFNWVVGVGLLILTMAFSFTGYLLPWDQLAVWAISVGARMAASVPFIGCEGPFGARLGMTPQSDLRAFLLGGPNVGGPTLLRFYVLHCFILPLATFALVAVHLWRVRKDGGISRPL